MKSNEEASSWPSTMPLSSPEDSVSCCDLLCDEDASELADDSPGSAALPEFLDQSDESIAVFIEVEADYLPRSDYPARFRSKSLDPFARQDAIAWILKVRSCYHFRPLTAYLAVNYLDRFLSSHSLPQCGWAMQLLSVASLSLAAKMEETLVPSLLDLQVEGAKFIFEPGTVFRMELLVLTALNWRLRSVTPFTFIDYFAHKIDPSGKHARYLASRATQSILATMKDVDFISHCPSSLAAAAILCATDDIQDLASVNPGMAVSWGIGLTQEGIANCYRVIRQAVADRVIITFPLILSQFAIPVSMRSELSSSSSPSIKRRKLDSNCLLVNDDKERL